MIGQSKTNHGCLTDEVRELTARPGPAEHGASSLGLLWVSGFFGAGDRTAPDPHCFFCNPRYE